MKICNSEIRNKIAESGIKMWEVAAEVGITDGTFSKWLRHELTADKKRRVLAAIEKLTVERESA